MRAATSLGRLRVIFFHMRVFGGHIPLLRSNNGKNQMGLSELSETLKWPERSNAAFPGMLPSL